MSAFAHIGFSGKSDIGRRRKNNEDNFGMFPEAGVWLVADGMGGGDDGEIASAAVVRAVESFIGAHPMPEPGVYAAKDCLRGLRGALNSASKWIFERARARRLESCGSTVVGVLFDATRPGRATAFHAGDSRLYRLRGRSLKQITRDHSAAEMIGEKDEAKVNPMFRGMILRAVGIRPSVEVEDTEFDVKKGDRIVICSDGLSRMVPDARIAEIVSSAEKDDVVATQLIAAANAAGGVDNVTVIVLSVGELPPARKSAPFLSSAAEPEAVSSGSRQDSNTSPTHPLVLGKSTSAVEDQPLIGEIEEQETDASRPRWLAHVLLAVAALIFIGVLAAAAFKELRPSAPPKNLPAAQPVVTNAPPARALAPVVTNAPPVRPSAPVVTNAPPVRPSAPVVTNAPPVRPSAPVVTNAPPAPLPLSKKPEANKVATPAAVNSELLAACSRASLDAVSEQLRRKLPNDKVYEFSEQMKRAQQSAQTAVNQKTEKAVERFLVDFKYSLQAASAARDSFSQNAALLAAWNCVAEEDVRSASVQEAAVRVVRELSK